jgi:hypothetical protein
MTANNSFPSINFTKYTCKINVIFNIINERKKKFLNNIENIRSLYMLKNDNSDFKYKIMFGVNTMIQRYIFFTKYSKQLIYHVNIMFKTMKNMLTGKRRRRGRKTRGRKNKKH